MNKILTRSKNGRLERAQITLSRSRDVNTHFEPGFLALFIDVLRYYKSYIRYYKSYMVG